MHGLGESHSNLVLQLITDILSVIGSHILHKLLPRCTHLVCGCLMAEVEDVCAESSAESILRCLVARTIVVVTASASTASPTSVAASSMTTSSSASSTHLVVKKR